MTCGRALSGIRRHGEDTYIRCSIECIQKAEFDLIVTGIAHVVVDLGFQRSGDVEAVVRSNHHQAAQQQDHPTHG